MNENTANKDRFAWRIRRMEECDLVQAEQIEKRNFSDPWTAKGLLEELNSEYAIYLSAAAEDGTLLGYCGLIRSFEDANIVNVSVDAPYRRMGVARQMLLRLMDEAGGQGVENFTLEVRVSNTAAIALYGQLGFKTAGIRPGFYEKPPEDAAIMWKRKRDG